jgi:hypothetical protein
VTKFELIEKSEKNRSRSREPSDRSFGFFMTFVLLLLALFFKGSLAPIHVTSLFLAGFITFLITTCRTKWLRRPKLLWIRLGNCLSKVISPIVMAVIYFIFFSSFALVLRAVNHDALDLKLKRGLSRWIRRGPEDKKINFLVQ